MNITNSHKLLFSLATGFPCPQCYSVAGGRLRPPATLERSECGQAGMTEERKRKWLIQKKW